MGRIAGKPWKMDKSEWLIDWENPEEVKKHSREYYRRNRDRLSKLKKDRYGGGIRRHYAGHSEGILQGKQG